MQNRERVQATYRRLVTDRKACSRCVELRNPSRHRDGAYDTDEIGHWTNWLGDVDAKIVVVGQDWGDIAYLDKHRGGEQAGNPTNRNLVRLFASIGIDIPMPEEGVQATGVFLTNAVLCCKTGGLQGAVRSQWFRNCSHFLKRTIELIGPRIVVALGEAPTRALLTAFECQIQGQSFRNLVESPFPISLTPSTRLVPVYHCGAGGTNRNRPFSLQLRDWQKVAGKDQVPGPVPHVTQEDLPRTGVSVLAARSRPAIMTRRSEPEWREPIESESQPAAWEQFVKQSNQFRLHVRPSTTPRDRRQPKAAGNWFSVAIPTGWGRSTGRDGFHWLMGIRQEESRPTRAVHLGVGVESPIRNDASPPAQGCTYRDLFVRWVLSDPELAIPRQFKMSAGERNTKLLISEEFPLNEKAGHQAIELFHACAAFNVLMERHIRKFWEEFGIRAFSKPLVFD